MSNEQIISPNAPVTGKKAQLPELFAWLAIGMFVLFTTAGAFVAPGSLMRPGYILVALLVGIFLYLRFPCHYVSFALWMWFITSFVARFVDLRAGYDNSRSQLVAQFIVTLIPFPGLLKQLPGLPSKGGFPFLLAFIGVFYAFFIGLIKTTPFTAARGMLDWLPPLVFGTYLFVNWRDYPQFRQVLQKTFLWGVLVTGSYGIFQYLTAPEWDRFWLLSAKLTSMGVPEPLKLRVWSTMASPAPFASMMLAGLLLIFSSKEALRLPAAGVGYLSFLLTMVRTMWGGWFVGVILLLGSLKAQLQMRLFVTILVMALCVIPLSTMEPFAKAIGDRLETLSNLEDDDSAKVRQQIYESGLNSALTNGLGNGIGNTFIVNKKGVLEPIVIDSGVLDMLFTLGWVGALCYLGALILVFYNLFQYKEFSFDTFLAAARAISVGVLTTLLGSSGMLGFSGMMLWGFLGISFAGHKYYYQQRVSAKQQQHAATSLRQA